MSSTAFRKASPRRTHHERGQPRRREKLGLLEKHKDYVQRARNYHAKQRRLKALQEKAALRNPDEFYYRMIHSRTVNGVHQGRRRLAGAGATADEDLLLRTQDANYLMHKLSVEQAALARLEAEVSGALVRERRSLNKKTVFVTAADRPVRSKTNESPTSSIDSRPILQDLKRRRTRVATLRRLARQVEVEKLVRGKGAKRKLRDYNPKAPALYRWRAERQK